MKFYHLSLTKLKDDRSLIAPFMPFENAHYQNLTYTPVFTTIQSACRHRYQDVFNTILTQGYATCYLYELHLSKTDISSLITPEVMLLDGFRYFDSALTETAKCHQEIELCCLTQVKEARYVGEVNIFESLAFRQPKGTFLHPYPAVMDYYVIVDRMSDDKSGFVRKKAFSQVSTEIRHISRGYEDLCLLFRQLGSGDDVVPLVLQRGQFSTTTNPYRTHYTHPCMTFVLSDKGDSLLRQYQVILKDVLDNYGFSPDYLFVIKSNGQFSRNVEDYYERERYRRVCAYSTSLISFVYRDSHILKDEEQLDRLKEAYELALLMLID